MIDTILGLIHSEDFKAMEDSSRETRIDSPSFNPKKGNDGGGLKLLPHSGTQQFPISDLPRSAEPVSAYSVLQDTLSWQGVLRSSGPMLLDTILNL